MQNFVKAAEVSELKPGQVKEITIGGRVLALCNVAGTFYALDNVCAHHGGPLGQGYVEGNKLECPWHGWQFDVKNGRATLNPGVAVPTYEVKVQGMDVLVAL